MAKKPKAISMKPCSFRDIYWCHSINEPYLILYHTEGVTCPGCGMTWPSTSHIDETEGHHWFLFHINKPYGRG